MLWDQAAQNLFSTGSRYFFVRYFPYVVYHEFIANTDQGYAGRQRCETRSGGGYVATGYSQAQRLIQMLHMINAEPGEYTVEKLAHYFSVSQRTIIRDINDLRDLDCRIETKEGTGGYQVFYDPLRLPMRLTEEEKAAIDLMPELAASRSTEPGFGEVMDAYHTAIAKVYDKLGFSSGAESWRDRLTERILLSPRDEDGNHDGSIIELFDAVQRQSTVDMTYYTASTGKWTQRMFDPYYILPRHNNLYAIGYCHLSDSFRTFRVSRMRNVRCLDRPYIEHEDFMLKRVVEQAFGVDSTGQLITAVVRFPKRVIAYVKEDIDNKNSILEETEMGTDSIQLKIRTHLNAEFLRWVFQYGSDIEVVGPDELVAEIRRSVQTLAQRYLGAGEAVPEA